jgi:FKBP-type peptidyl-prolyl cis-trans isomerase
MAREQDFAVPPAANKKNRSDGILKRMAGGLTSVAGIATAIATIMTSVSAILGLTVHNKSSELAHASAQATVQARQIQQQKQQIQQLKAQAAAPSASPSATSGPDATPSGLRYLSNENAVAGNPSPGQQVIADKPYINSILFDCQFPMTCRARPT